MSKVTVSSRMRYRGSDEELQFRQVSLTVYSSKIDIVPALASLHLARSPNSIETFNLNSVDGLQRIELTE